MPGIRITNLNTTAELFDYQYAQLRHDHMSFKEWSIDRATLRKFEWDKLFLECDHVLVVLEGVVLNTREIMGRCGADTWKDAVLHLIREEGPEWFKTLIGPFSGAVYYKDQSKWIIFTGPLGEKPVFYWAQGDRFIAASQMQYLVDILKEKGIPRIPDEDALCRLMAYNSYIDDETCIKGVKRLYPGTYLVRKDEDISVHTYVIYDYKQDYGQNVKSEKEYIDQLDNAFCKAFSRILDKDKEYGYKTLIDVSGGYDSRLNIYTAHRLHAKNIMTDCYAQSGCHDHIVSQKISSELGYQYIFMSLDNADCMYGVDDNVRMLSGTAGYGGITGGRDMLHMLSGLDFGLEVTGLLGDVHDGSMLTSNPDGEIDAGAFRESKTLVEGNDFLFPAYAKERFRYHLNDHFWFYNRGMLCGMTSFLIRQNFIEPVTPFGDPTFLGAYMPIPWEMRVKGRLLRKWMADKYPAAALYTNERTGMKLKTEVLPYGPALIKIGKQMIKAKQRFSIKRNITYGMNDMGVWYDTNASFRKYVDRNVSEQIDGIAQYQKVSNALNKLATSGTITDKLMIMTVHSIFRCFIQ